LENEDVQVNSIKEIENILTKEAKQRSIVPQIDKQVQELLAEVSEYRTGSGVAANLSHTERANALNTLFAEKVIALFTDINERAVDCEADVQLYYWQALEYQNRNNKADLIR
jgi:hypothetical protein